MTFNKMSHLDDEMKQKKQVLKETVGDIKTYSIQLKGDLDSDKERLKKIAVAYEHSGGLLSKANQALDRVLAQSEVRVIIYVVGIILMLFVATWKFFL